MITDTLLTLRKGNLIFPLTSSESLALILARRLGEDVAHHDGSVNPYGYVLVRPNGDRFEVNELADESDGLHLDETAECMRQPPPLPE
jgi:hypothetical protein